MGDSKEAELNSEGIKDQSLEHKTFVYENYRYYYFAWNKSASPGRALSWNWAAFFGGVFWLGYRKMYFYVPIILGLFVLSDIISFMIDFKLNYLVTLSYIFFMGSCSNALYYRHMSSTIKHIKEDINEPEKQIAKISQIGGVSWKGVGISLLLLIMYEVYWGIWYN